MSIARNAFREKVRRVVRQQAAKVASDYLFTASTVCFAMSNGDHESYKVIPLAGIAPALRDTVYDLFQQVGTPRQLRGLVLLGGTAAVSTAAGVICYTLKDDHHMPMFVESLIGAGIYTIIEVGIDLATQASDSDDSAEEKEQEQYNEKARAEIEIISAPSDHDATSQSSINWNNAARMINAGGRVLSTTLVTHALIRCTDEMAEYKGFRNPYGILIVIPVSMVVDSLNHLTIPNPLKALVPAYRHSEEFNADDTPKAYPPNSIYYWEFLINFAMRTLGSAMGAGLTRLSFNCDLAFDGNMPHLFGMVFLILAVQESVVGIGNDLRAYRHFNLQAKAARSSFEGQLEEGDAFLPPTGGSVNDGGKEADKDESCWKRMFNVQR